MSKLTDFLKLHIWEIPKDNNEQFDYKKSIGDNFEKIDKGLKDAVDKFTEPLSYKDEVVTFQDLPTTATNGDIYNVTSENKNYIYNGTNWVPYSSTLDLTYLENNTKTIQTTEVSEELTINNCAGVKGKLDIKSGKSEQATRSGKNKLPNYRATTQTINNLTFTNNNDGSFSLNGTASAFSQFIDTNTFELKAGTHTLQSNNTNTSLTLQLRNEDGTTIIAQTTTHVTFTLSSDTIVKFRAVIGANGSFSNSTIFPLLYSGEYNSSMEYEQYGVSPSPKYPSPIRNVGDNINLAQLSTTIWVNSQPDIFVTTENVYSFIAKVKPNTEYIIHKKNKGNRFLVATSKTIPQNNTNCSRFVFASNHNLTKYKLTTQENENYIFLGVYYGTNAEEIKQAIEEVKIEEGPIETPYTPYNCGSADFKADNKNFLPNYRATTQTTNNLTFTNNNDGSFSLNGTASAFSQFIDSKSFKIKAGNYALKSNNSVLGLTLQLRSEDGLTILGQTSTKTTFTIPSDMSVKFRVVVTSNTKLNNEVIYPMLSKDINDEYMPHQEQIISFPFTEGQVLHKGDYLADDGIHQKRKTLVLTGTENIQSAGSNIFWLDLTGYTGNKDYDVISNQYKYSIYENRLINRYCVGLYNNTGWTNARLFFHDENYSTVAEFKAMLAEQYANGTPVIIEYNLAEEIVIPYTSEQEEAYYELQHLLMYEGYTSITCIDEIKPDIQGTYYFNNELNKSYGERFDKVDKSIKELQDNVDVLNEYNKDTGWKSLVILSSGSGYYRKIGNMVNMVLKCTPTATYQTILNIPDDILPKQRLVRYTKKSTENKLGTFGLNPSDKKLWFYTGDVNTEYEIDFMYFTD